MKNRKRLSNNILFLKYLGFGLEFLRNTFLTSPASGLILVCNYFLESMQTFLLLFRDRPYQIFPISLNPSNKLFVIFVLLILFVFYFLHVNRAFWLIRLELWSECIVRFEGWVVLKSYPNGRGLPHPDVFHTGNFSQTPDIVGLFSVSGLFVA